MGQYYCETRYDGIVGGTVKELRKDERERIALNLVFRYQSEVLALLIDALGGNL